MHQLNLMLLLQNLTPDMTIQDALSKMDRDLTFTSIQTKVNIKKK